MTIFHLSVYGSLLIISILAIRAVLLNKLPKGMFKILWILAAIKLICPFTIPFEYSLSSIFSRFNPVKYIDAKIAYDSGLLYENIDYSKFNEYSNHITNPHIKSYFMNYISTYLDVFLLGISVLLIVSVGIIYFNYYLRFRNCAIFVNELCDEIIKKENLKRRVVVKISNDIKSPLTYGIIKPVILLPINSNQYSAEALELVILHELTHIKNFDQLYKILLVFVLCLHWFNPLVWMMYFLANKDIELLCDASVMARTQNLKKRQYAYMLIAMADYKNKETMMVSYFSSMSFEGRIRSIMLSKKFKLRHFVVGALIVLTITAVFFTGQNYASEFEPKYATLKDGSRYMDITATVQENKTLMDIKLVKNKFLVTGREYWKKGDVIRMKLNVDIDADTFFEAGIVPAEKMEEGWKYDDYGKPIVKKVSSKESFLEFVVPKTAEYGIFMTSTDSNFRNGRIRSRIQEEEEYNLEKNLNVMNIQLELNKEFKNPLHVD